MGSREGHLSNTQAMRLLERIAGPELEVVALGHLSESNNSPDVALKTVGAVLDGAGVHLRVANRKTPTELIEFPGEFEPWEPEPPLQGSLF